jgi:hypothetical protein
MRFYENAMRNASLILFWSAFGLFLGSVLVSAGIYGQLFQHQGNEFSEPMRSNDFFWQMVSTTLNALSSALLPFFGAAFLWTLERIGRNRGDAQ